MITSVFKVGTEVLLSNGDLDIDKFLQVCFLKTQTVIFSATAHLCIEQ